VVLSGPNRVNVEVEKMVGISSEIIKKTVYIRQKEVDDLARADGIELRRLITTFFGLDEFDQIKDNLRDRSSNLQNSISSLNQSVGTLNSEKGELMKKEQETNKCDRNIISKETDLDNEVKECSKIPSEDTLIRIGDIQSEITEGERKLEIIKTRMADKMKLRETSDFRVNKFKAEITKMNANERKDQGDLKLLPSRENLERLSELQSRVLNVEHGIRNIITRSGLTIEFDPIENPNRINTRYESLKDELKATKECEDQLSQSIEELNRRLSFNGALSNLKVNSINYIEEKNNCPVCNKPIENKNNMISQINEEVYTINLDNGSLNKELNEQTKTLKDIKAKVSSNDAFRNLLSSLLPHTDDLIFFRKELLSLLSTFAAQTIQEFLTRLGYSSINDIISRRAVLESNIQGYIQRCMDLEKDITNEIEYDNVDRLLVSTH
jgi:hypothetical protein